MPASETKIETIQPSAVRNSSDITGAKSLQHGGRHRLKQVGVALYDIGVRGDENDVDSKNT